MDKTSFILAEGTLNPEIIRSLKTAIRSGEVARISEGDVDAVPALLRKFFLGSTGSLPSNTSYLNDIEQFDSASNRSFEQINLIQLRAFSRVNNGIDWSTRALHGKPADSDTTDQLNESITKLQIMLQWMYTHYTGTSENPADLTRKRQLGLLVASQPKRVETFGYGWSTWPEATWTSTSLPFNKIMGRVAQFGAEGLSSISSFESKTDQIKKEVEDESRHKAEVPYFGKLADASEQPWAMSWIVIVCSVVILRASLEMYFSWRRFRTNLKADLSDLANDIQEFPFVGWRSIENFAVLVAPLAILTVLSLERDALTNDLKLPDSCLNVVPIALITTVGSASLSALLALGMTRAKGAEPNETPQKLAGSFSDQEPGHLLDLVMVEQLSSDLRERIPSIASSDFKGDTFDAGSTRVSPPE